MRPRPARTLEPGHVFEAHLGGKIEVTPRLSMRTRSDLAIAYTPGVAAVSAAIAQQPDLVWDYTVKGNAVAVVSDGSAVLGLGNIGPQAALPVMEGKAMLFKALAGIDAYPLVLEPDPRDPIGSFIAAVRAISPGFGGINLEDIAAPRCFEIERRLTHELNIPVFHDDQHGTAIVVLAALKVALTATGRTLADTRFVVLGAGAAGTAITGLLLDSGAQDVVVADRLGILHPQRRDPLSEEKRHLAAVTNPRGLTGQVQRALVDADVLVGVSQKGIVDPHWLSTMAARSIVLALANPDPEVERDQVPENVEWYASGRSDDENQINNVLAFPGIFRGLLDVGASRVTEAVKQAAVQALVEQVGPADLTAGRLLPSPMDPAVARHVAERVRVAAVEGART